MKTIEEKLNEIEQRHTAEIKALREELKEGEEKPFKDGDPLLGGLFYVFEISSNGCIKVTDAAYDVFTFNVEQQKQLKAIEGIIKAAGESSLRSVGVAFLEAKELGLEF